MEHCLAAAQLLMKSNSSVTVFVVVDLDDDGGGGWSCSWGWGVRFTASALEAAGVAPPADEDGDANARVDTAQEEPEGVLGSVRRSNSLSIHFFELLSIAPLVDLTIEVHAHALFLTSRHGILRRIILARVAGRRGCITIQLCQPLITVVILFKSAGMHDFAFTPVLAF